MIRILARMAAYCVVLIPVLAFTGDIDGWTAFNALWPRLLVITVVVGGLLLAIEYVYGRQLTLDIDEFSERPSPAPPNAALWGLCIAGVLVSAIAMFLYFRNDPWVQAAGSGSLTLFLPLAVPILLLLAKHFDGERER